MSVHLSDTGSYGDVSADVKRRYWREFARFGMGLVSELPNLR